MCDRMVQRASRAVRVSPSLASLLGALLDELGAESLREIGPVSPRVAEAREARAREAQACGAAGLRDNTRCTASSLQACASLQPY